MLTLCITGHFYYFFCKFSDDFQISSYIKCKKGTENKKSSWIHWQNLTNVSSFTILASSSYLFLKKNGINMFETSSILSPTVLFLRSTSVLHILAYVFVLLCVPTRALTISTCDSFLQIIYLLFQIVSPVSIFHINQWHLCITGF